MDVSPKQLVSVAAALIPFLENDDANRCADGLEHAAPGGAAGSRRSAVRRYRHGRRVARDSGASISARRTGVVDQVDATRIVVRATGETDPTKPGVDIYRLMKYQRSKPEHLHQPASAGEVGDKVEKATSSPTVPRPISASSRSPQRAGRVHAVERLQLRGLDPALRADRERRRVHVHTTSKNFEVMARDTKLGPEEITRDIPNVSEEALKKSRRSGHRLYRRRVHAGDILVGKITPQGRKPDDAEEKLLRAIFGEKASDVARHLVAGAAGRAGHRGRSAGVSTGTASRRTSARSPSSAEEIERLAKDRDDEQSILDRNVYGRLAELLEAPGASRVPRASRRIQDHQGGAG